MREPIGIAEIDCSLLARVDCATVNNISNRASELRWRLTEADKIELIGANAE